MNNTSMKRFSVEQVLARASQLHIALSVEGDILRISAPKGALNEKIRSVLKAYKSELMAHLRAQEQAYLHTHDEGPLCARCLDIDRDNPLIALLKPYVDGFYYCERHYPALQQERGNSHG